MPGIFFTMITSPSGKMLYSPDVKINQIKRIYNICIYYFFQFETGITSFDLSSTVTSPGGVTEDAEINEVQDGLYAVHFVPKELGVHTVSVKYKDIHIPGNVKQAKRNHPVTDMVCILRMR